MSRESLIRFAELARSFHAIRDIDPRFEVWVDVGGVSIVDLSALDAYGVMYAGDGTRCVVAFLLNLWSTREPWRTGAFDVFAALVAWDDAHRAAWQAWAAAPWRP